MTDISVFGTPWQEVVDWYLAQPVYGQILVLIGAFALLALAVVIVYYVLKGVAYLIYYILKGVYYLLKGIGLLFYKICEGLYYLISGKPKPSKKNQEQPIMQQMSEPIVKSVPVVNQFQVVQPEITFCSECGNKFSESMMRTLGDKGFVYCIHCGKGFQANAIKIEAQ